MDFFRNSHSSSNDPVQRANRSNTMSVRFDARHDQGCAAEPRRQHVQWHDLPQRTVEEFVVPDGI